MLYDIPTTKTPRACAFGYGNKVISTLAVRLNAKYNPSPDRYHLTGFTHNHKVKKKGKTFGITHSAREWVPTHIRP